MSGSHQDNPRVRFKEIDDDALIVEVNCYLDSVEWSGYREIAEDLNLKILEIVQDAGTSLALPTQSVRIEQRPPRYNNAQ